VPLNGMTVKRNPHHDLAAIQAKFADAESLEITTKAVRDAQAIGYSPEDIVDVVQALESGDCDASRVPAGFG
jgi:motility quorum-sensing regulator / GCU-specific mRNA interferase toxin